MEIRSAIRNHPALPRRTCAALAVLGAPPLTAPANPPGFETVITLTDQTPPLSGSIGSSTQLNVMPGGIVLDGFQAGAQGVPSTNIEVNVLGGHVGDFFFAWSGVTVNVSAGYILRDFVAGEGCVVNLETGGIISDTADFLWGGTLNLRGGWLGHDAEVAFGSHADISGGTVGDRFRVFEGCTLNVTGYAFRLAGVPIPGLVTGSPTVVTARDVTLSCRLADGTPFSLDLYSIPFALTDHVSTDAVLTVTLSPPPPCDADLNHDGVLDLGDIQTFIPLFLGRDPAADFNHDGILDFGDIGAFIAAFLAGC